jgi:hypothetical protein
VTLTVIERLILCETALIEALDGDDVAVLERATTDFGGTLDLLKDKGAWHATPETVAQLTRALALAEAARVRVNYLTDRTRRRIDLLGEAAGVVPMSRYRRDGRLRA